MIPELRALVEPQCKRDAAWEEIIELAERHDAALYQAWKQSKEKHRSLNPRKPQHNNASNSNKSRQGIPIKEAPINPRNI